MITATPTMLHPSSPLFHPRRVKEVGLLKSPYTGRNNNSLFFFLSFTPIPSRDARPRIYACVCEGGGERGERSFGAARPHLGAAARVRAVGHVLAHVASVVAPWPSGPTPRGARRGAKGAKVPKWQRADGGNGSSLAILGRRWPRERQPLATDFLS